MFFNLKDLEITMKHYGIDLNDEDLDCLVDLLLDEFNVICGDNFFYGINLEDFFYEFKRSGGSFSNMDFEGLIKKSLDKLKDKKKSDILFEETFIGINEHLKFREKSQIDRSVFSQKDLQDDLLSKVIYEKMLSDKSMPRELFCLKIQKEEMVNFMIDTIIPFIDESEYDNDTKEELRKLFREKGKELFSLAFSADWLKRSKFLIAIDIIRIIGLKTLFNYSEPMVKIAEIFKLHMENLNEAVEQMRCSLEKRYNL